MPLLEIGDPGPSRSGMADDLVEPAVATVMAENETPVSVSTVVPAALTTVNVVDAWEIAAVPGVESKMLAVTVSEHEYLTLSRAMALFGKVEGPLVGGVASAKKTGPDTTRAYCWPGMSSSPLPFRSSLTGGVAVGSMSSLPLPLASSLTVPSAPPDAETIEPGTEPPEFGGQPVAWPTL